MDDRLYLSLNPYVALIMAINDNDGIWDKDSSVMIKPIDIYEVVNGLKNVIRDIIDTKNMFWYEKTHNGTELKLSGELARKSQRLVKLYGGDGHILMIPARVPVENDELAEGVAVAINKSATVIGLPIQQAEHLLYIMDKIDIHLYSQMIMNYVVNCYGKHSNVEPKELKTSIVFSKPVVQEEVDVVSTLDTSKKQKDVFDSSGLERLI